MLSTSAFVTFVQAFAVVFLSLLLIALAVAAFIPKQNTTRPRIDDDDSYYK